MWSGWFSKVTLPTAMTGDWFWQFDYGNGESSLVDALNGSPTGSFLSATLTQLTVVPEPGTLVLLLTGGLGLALAALRRRRRS